MDLLFLMDPMETANPAADTSWALMGRAAERGHRTFFAHPSTLSLEGGEAVLRARAVRVDRAAARFEWQGDAAWKSASDFSMVWIRKDPPFDLAYVETTWMLEHVDAARCKVVNSAAGIRGANEKLYALKFPELIPPTLVTADRGRLRDFVRTHREVVLKPLGGAGGDGIVFAQEGMRGLTALLEVATPRGQRCEAQAYLPGAPKGDKRILLLDGEVLGAVLRVHGEGEERNNLHLGGHAEASTLDEHDRRIVAGVGPQLRRDGLWFVGLDVIDGKLTEVNVTSPTGIQEIERLDGVDATGRVIDWCEANDPRASR
jgi:glutathione synthase